MHTLAIAHRAVKYNVTFLAALIVTFLLFYFMQYLIATNGSTMKELNVIKLHDSTVPVFDNYVIEQIEPPAPLVKVTPQDIEIPARQTDANNSISYSSNWVQPATPNMDVASIPLSSNVMIPLIRTVANYPSRALARGIEGFVELSFTVNEIGNVQDPVVIYAEPEGYFERAALQSIERWKYAPAKEKGQPIPTYGVRQRIVFEIDPSSR